MMDTAVFAQATQNMRAIYHICPNMHPDEIEIGKMAIAAAKRNNVARFIYHSVMHPQTETMPHHWNKLQVEALLFSSGPELYDFAASSLYAKHFRWLG